MNLNLLPRRKRRTPEPGRHATAAVRHAKGGSAPATATVTVTMTGPPEAIQAIDNAIRGAGHEHAPDPEDTMLLRPAVPEPEITGTAAELVKCINAEITRIPPLAVTTPETVPAAADVLARVLDGLRKSLPDEPEPIAVIRAAPAEPGAYLRAIMPGVTHPWDALTGSPCFAGVTHTPDGRPQAGIYLGDEDADGRIVLDVTDAGWLRALVGAALEALAVLETGRPWPGPGIGPLEFLAGALFDALSDGRGDEHRMAAYDAALALLVPAVFPAPAMNGAGQ